MLVFFACAREHQSTDGPSATHTEAAPRDVRPRPSDDDLTHDTGEEEWLDADERDAVGVDDPQPARLFGVTCAPAPVRLRGLRRARSTFDYHGYPVTLDVPASNDVRTQALLAYITDAAREWGQPYWLPGEDESDPDCPSCSVRVRCDLGQVLSSRISFKCSQTVETGGACPLYQLFAGTLLMCQSGVKRVAICLRGSACRGAVDKALSKRVEYPWVSSSECPPRERFHDDAWLDASGRLNVSLTGYHVHMEPEQVTLRIKPSAEEFVTRVPRWVSQP